ncbi:hypothetical protein [Xanthobacter sp. KR7-225]|uniref:hypothetical protein n=1 Tax=Xanthobacter sp. KR7-225 TaxID=3156613 RepID=UPI0032B378C4
MTAYPDQSWFDVRTLRPDRVPRPAPRFAPGCRAAIHLAVCLEAYPLGARPPFPVPGALDRPHPDLANWSQRKVALREGLARIEALLEDVGIGVSFVVQSQALDELSGFLPLLRDPRHAIVAGGAHAAALHSTFADAEAEMLAIHAVLERLRGGLGVPVEAWRSPSGVHSRHTFAVLARAGVRAVLDLNNDELPFAIKTEAGTLQALPWQHFSSDLHCLGVCKQPVRDFLNDLSEGIAWLIREAPAAGPRVLTLPVHPWIIGAPHRFRPFAQALRAWAQTPGVEFVNVRSLLAAAEPDGRPA